MLLISGLTACSNEIREIPPGYVGKQLTPTGFAEEWLEAGQTNLGERNAGETYNVMVLLEATTFTIKEQFLSAQASPDKEDHRITTIDGVPLTVDLYIRVAAPDDPTKRDAILAQVTPKQDGDDVMVKRVTLQMIYDQFAGLDVRGKTRAIFSEYKNYDSIMANYVAISEQIGAMVIHTFEQNGVPLNLLNAQLGNAKADQSVWETKAKLSAVAAEVTRIDSIGAALNRNPAYTLWYRANAMKDIGQLA